MPSQTPSSRSERRHPRNHRHNSPIHDYPVGKLRRTPPQRHERSPSQDRARTPPRPIRRAPRRDYHRVASPTTPSDEDQTRGCGPIRGIQAFSPGLRAVRWPSRFKPGPNEGYDGSTNPIEFLQIYTTAIEVAGGDEKVMANYLPTVLKGSARTWLVNLPNGSIYSWEELCDVF